MQELANKQDRPQSYKPASPAVNSTSAPAPGYPSNRILQLQGTVGNRAVQRLMQPHSEEVEAGPLAGEPVSPAYDHVSRVSLLRSAIQPTGVQPGTENGKHAGLAENEIGQPPPDASREQFEHVTHSAVGVRAHVGGPAAQANAATSATTIPQWAAASALQRSCNCPEGTCDCGQDELTRSATGDEAPAVAPPSVFDVLRSSGEPLDSGTRGWFEPRLGMDLGEVRVHHDSHQATSTAREVRASAYTVGRHIVFGAGKYAPGSPAGREVLAHELAHVAQQQDVASPSGPLLVSRPGDTDEVAAHKMADALLAGQSASPGPGSLQHVVRYPDPPAAVSIASPLPAATTVTSPGTSTTRPDGSAIPGGWAGASGPNAAPSRIGTVERVPIEGLPGNQREQPDLPGGKPADSYKTSAAIGRRTTEGAGRAVALVPDSVRTGGPGPVDVLLHLHGLGGGMRRRDGDPTDVGDYDMPQQIQAFLASRPDERLIALLPIGISVQPAWTGPKGHEVLGFHNTSFGDLDLNKFISVCFSRLSGSLPSGATPGRVILSAHSGGGLEISRMIAAKRLPSNVVGVLSFESIHKDLPTWTAFVLSHLHNDLKELERLRTTTSDPASLLQAQRSYLTESGFRFVAMARSSSGYGKRVQALRAAIVDWFGQNASALATATAGQNSVQDLLWANYQAVAASTGSHDEALATAQHNLGRALATLPPSPMAAASVITTTTTLPATTGVQRLARQSAPPMTVNSSEAARLLTDAAVAMGRQDKVAVVTPSQDRTRLRQDDIRAAIAARATNRDLDQAFTDGVAEIVAASDADRPAAVKRRARGIRSILETQFVHDPARSALDLLDPASATRYRRIHWDPADYPGGPAGPNEDAARSMVRAMTAIIPERRPHKGAANVMTSEELTAKAEANIKANWTGIRGQPGQLLLTPAADAFEKMQQAAKLDGVDLSINNSFRSFAVAKAKAAAAANPEAQASFSAHSLGLAVDFNLTAGKQHFAEVTTTPMQNVANMRSSPTHKWMALHGEEFGWYPFGNEPWHWEYNPPGFRDTFRALVFPQASTKPLAPAATPLSGSP